MRGIVLGMAATFSFAILPASANAQPAQTATLSSEVKPVFQSGQLLGCAINFEVARQDPEHNAGKFSYLRGSLNLYAWEDREPIFVLKLGVMSEAEGGFMPPADAFLVSGLKTNAVDAINTMESDTAGFRLFSFGAREATIEMVATAIAETERLTFSYAMREDGMHAIVPIDLRMGNVDLDNPENSKFNEQPVLEWLECLEAAISKE